MTPSQFASVFGSTADSIDARLFVDQSPPHRHGRQGQGTTANANQAINREMIPFIDLNAQQQRIRRELDEAIGGVLEHGRYILGPEVAELESRLAAFAGTRHCLTCSSGTDALVLGLMAMDIGPGCAVFTTPFTFIATVGAIRLVGATPVLVDIEPATFNLSPSSLELAIREIVTERKLCPSCIIPVDLFGHPCDYNAIRQVADTYKIPILQDSAQAFGAVYNGKRCPAHGTIGATSFFPAKPLGCYGDGGAVFTHSDTMCERLASIRVHGMGKDKYDTVRLGINGRFDTLQAAILLPKLGIYEEEIQARQKVARNYLEAIGTIDGLTCPIVQENCLSVWAQFTLRHANRDRIRDDLKTAGIPTAVYYPTPVHQSEAYASAVLKPVELTESERAAAEVFSVPFHPYLGDDIIERVASAIRKAVN